MPDAERLGQIMGQLVIQLFSLERNIHALRASEGVAGTPPAHPGLDAEQRHDAVADELVDPAVLGFNRLAHGLEVLIEQEHALGRQTVLRTCG